MIEVKELRKKYGEKEALRGIDFMVTRGGIFGFLGPNGAGKTTTMKILTGQLQASSGWASIMGRDVLAERREIQSRMGIVPEQTNLYERLTVGQNLSFFCRLYGSSQSMADQYLEKVGLSKEKNSQIKKLSKGMKQRVLLARALMHQPEVLFLDEPTSGLDPSSAANIHELLTELNQAGMTIFLTSHNMEEVDRLCHRVAFLDHGLIGDMGTPNELKLKYSTGKMRVQLQGEHGVEEQMLDMTGEESARRMAEWMQCGRIKAVHSCEPTLGDIFMKITGGDIL